MTSRSKKIFPTHSTSSITDHNSQTSDKLQCTIKTYTVTNNKLCGEIEIGASQSTIIHSAVIEIYGRAKCKFKLQKCRMKFVCIYTPKTVVERNDDFFYAKVKLIYEPEFSTPHQRIYSFACILPEGLPGSIAAEFGAIYYNALFTFHLDREDRFEYLQEIEIKGSRNLVMEPHLNADYATHTVRNLFLVQKMGSVCIDVWVPLVGYALGQSIPVLCTIQNRSAMHFGGLIFILTKTDCYKSKSPVVAEKMVRTDVCRVARMTDIHRGKYEYYTLLRVDEAQLPTISMRNCVAFRILYDVCVCLEGAFLRNHGKISPRRIMTPPIRVTIGTKPLITFNANRITNTLLDRINELKSEATFETSAIELMKLYDECIDSDKTIESQLSEEGMINLNRELINTYELENRK